MHWQSQWHTIPNLARALVSSPHDGSSLKIERIDSRSTDVQAALARLRQRLSPQGNVVSEAGRQRTIEVFGSPLSPEQVVERDLRRRADPRAGGGARLYAAARPGRSDAPPRCGCRPRSWPRPTPRRIRNSWPRCGGSATTFWNFNGRSCRRMSRCGGPTAASCGSAICRLRGWASACPAARRPILRPC